MKPLQLEGAGPEPGTAPPAFHTVPQLADQISATDATTADFTASLWHVRDAHARLAGQPVAQCAFTAPVAWAAPAALGC